MRRRNIISRLEKSSNVPEKLYPQKIKEMLDRTSMIRPVIDTRQRSEVRLNSIRSSIIRSIAAAAVFVLAVGGMTMMKFGYDAGNANTSPASPPPEVADAEGLTGLRGGSYSSLYNYLINTETPTITNSVDELYAYTSDSEKNAGFDAEVSEMFRKKLGSKTISSGSDRYTVLTEENFSADDNSDDPGLKLVQQNASAAFAAGYTDIYAYQLKGGETEKINYDFMEDTYFNKVLADNPVCEERGHTLKAYILGLYLADNRLIALFDFHLPEKFDEHIVMHEYCGFCVYDVSDADNISLVYEYEQPGCLAEAMLTADGKLSLLSEYSRGRTTCGYTSYKDGSPKYLPMLYENGEVCDIAENRIYISNKSRDPALTLVSTFENITDENDNKTDINIQNDGCFAVTCNTQSIVRAKDCFLLLTGYIGNTGGDVSHIIKADVTDGKTVISAAKYVEGSAYEFQFGYLGNGFSETDDFYIIASPAKVMVFTKDLEPLGECMSEYYFPYSEVYEDDEQISYMNDIPVLNGTTVYYCDMIMNYTDRMICRESVDLSDPKAPVHTIYKNSADAPAVIDAMSLWNADGFKLDNKHFISLEHQYDNGYSEYLGSFIKLYSLDPKLVHYTEEKFSYLTDTDGKTTFELNRPSDIYSTDLVKLSTSTDWDSMDSSGTAEYYDSENSLIFLPLRNLTRKIHEISEEEYEAMTIDDIGRFGYDQSIGENGMYENKYYYIDNLTETISVLVIKFDKEKNTLEPLGEFCGTVLSAENEHDIGFVKFIGTAYLNGKLYVFTDKGMTCTSLKSVYLCSCLYDGGDI